MTITEEPFKTFKVGFKGDLIRPGDSTYEESIKRWSKLSERKAGIVAYPSCTEDVVRTVKYAVQESIQLVVKS